MLNSGWLLVVEILCVGCAINGSLYTMIYSRFFVSGKNPAFIQVVSNLMNTFSSIRFVNNLSVIYGLSYISTGSTNTNTKYINSYY
jgi:hypothetical protein